MAAGTTAAASAELANVVVGTHKHTIDFDHYSFASSVKEDEVVTEIEYQQQ